SVNKRGSAEPRTRLARANAEVCAMARRYNAGRASSATPVTQVQPDAELVATREPARGKRLDSWKEIAAYLTRDVATVRRWEKREALPVHRHLHEKLGSVFA